MNRCCAALSAAGWLTLMMLAGCAQAPPPPPPDTRAADEKSIRDAEVASNAGWKARDIEKIVALYADDATLMVPDAPLMKGKDAIRGGLKEFLMDPNLSLTFTASVVEVSKGGGLAYSQGTYTLTQTNPKTKKPVVEKGRYVTVYRKTADGSWRAVEDINNAEAPATPAETGK
jgi:uncharacterized protein (TIGR02246 family)